MSVIPIPRRPGISPPRAPAEHLLWPVSACLGAALLGGALVGQGATTLAVSAVVAGLFLIAAVASPERVILGLIVVVPFLVYPVTVGRFSILVGVPAFGLVGLLLLVGRASPGPGLARRVPRWSFAALVAVAFGTALVSTDPTTSESRVIYLALFGLVAWALAAAIISGRLRRATVIGAVVLSAAIAAAAVIGQVFYGLAVGRGGVTDWLNSVYPLFGGVRASGVTGNNWYINELSFVRGIFPFMAAPSAGQYLMLGLVASVWSLRGVAGGTPLRRVGYLIATALIATGLVLTVSRQAWVGAVAGLLALGARRGRVQTLVGCGGALALTAAMPIPGTSSTVGEYLLTAGDRSTASTGTRIGLWQQALHLIPAHALRGVGPGLYGTLNPDPQNPVYYAHNVFLDATVELGFVGVAALVAVVVVALRTAFLREATVGFAMIIAFVVASLFDDVLYFPKNGLLLAVGFALCAAGGKQPIPGGPADRLDAGSSRRLTPTHTAAR